MLSLLLKLKENAESLAVKLRQVLGGVDLEELQAVLQAAYGPFEAQISRSARLHATESPSQPRMAVSWNLLQSSQLRLAVGQRRVPQRLTHGAGGGITKCRRAA